jgi:hypothetical protein
LWSNETKQKISKKTETQKFRFFSYLCKTISKTNKLKMSKRLNLLITLVAVAATVFITLNFRNTGDFSEEYLLRAQNNYRVFSPVIPDEMDFCGERVPLEIYHVYERMDRELLVNMYWQSNIILLIKRANRFFPVIEPILAEHGLPDDFKYLALAESSFTYAVSPAGAAGFWQFLKGTGQQYGLEVNNEIDERYHLEKATAAAAKYLKANYERFDNSWTLAAAAYNTGESNIRRHIRNQEITDYYHMHLPEETSRYVFRILALKTIFEDPIAYGIILREKDLYPQIPVKTVVVDTTVTDLFAFAREQGTTYQQLKSLNPWLRNNNLPNKSRKKYDISIPLNASLLRENLHFRDDNENVLQEFEN